jgi:hypothetical protein
MDLPDPRQEGVQYRRTNKIWALQMANPFSLTVNGMEMAGREGDYLISDADGHQHVVPAEIFKQNYEAVPT